MCLQDLCKIRLFCFVFNFFFSVSFQYHVLSTFARLSEKHFALFIFDFVGRSAASRPKTSQLASLTYLFHQVPETHEVNLWQAYIYATSFLITSACILFFLYRSNIQWPSVIALVKNTYICDLKQEYLFQWYFYVVNFRLISTLSLFWHSLRLKP